MQTADEMRFSDLLTPAPLRQAVERARQVMGNAGLLRSPTLAL